MLRIGVNALYLIPGGVGGTEIYLRNLLRALAEIDAVNQYVVFTNRETGRGPGSGAPEFRRTLRSSCGLRSVRREFFGSRSCCRLRCASIVWMCCSIRDSPRLLLCGCPMVTVFHDLQHKRHPEYFRWFDLPFWNFFLWASAQRSRGLIAVSVATRDDLQRFYGGRCGGDPSRRGARVFRDCAQRREPKDYLLCVSTSHPHKNLDCALARVCASRETCRTWFLPGCGDLRRREVEEPGGGFREDHRLDSARASSTSYFAGRAGSFIHLHSKASGCRCSKRWRPECRWPAPIFRRCARSRDPRFTSSIPQAIARFATRWMRLAAGKIPTEAAQQRAREFTWEKTARATLDYLSKSSS